MAALHGDRKMQANLAALIAHLKPETIIETGTFRGDSTRWFAAEVQRRVPLGRVITCEIRDDFADQAEASFAAHRTKNITLYRGSSIDRLPEMIGVALAREGPCLCFIDAHWSVPWPLFDELKICNRVRAVHPRRITIIVDDFEVPGRPNFSAPAGGGGTPGDPIYGPRDTVDRTPCSLETFGDLLSGWGELWFPNYDDPAAGYVIASDNQLNGLPFAERYDR